MEPRGTYNSRIQFNIQKFYFLVCYIFAKIQICFKNRGIRENSIYIQCKGYCITRLRGVIIKKNAHPRIVPCRINSWNGRNEHHESQDARKNLFNFHGHSPIPAAGSPLRDSLRLMINFVMLDSPHRTINLIMLFGECYFCRFVILLT